jgi:hypothetical protein
MSEKEDKTVEILKIARELNALLLKLEAQPRLAIPALLFVASSGAIFLNRTKEDFTSDLHKVFEETETIIKMTGQNDG